MLTNATTPTEAVNTSVPIWMVDSPVSVDLGIYYKRTENPVQVQLCNQRSIVEVEGLGVSITPDYFW